MKQRGVLNSFPASHPPIPESSSFKVLCLPPPHAGYCSFTEVTPWPALFSLLHGTLCSPMPVDSRFRETAECSRGTPALLSLLSITSLLSAWHSPAHSLVDLPCSLRSLLYTAFLEYIFFISSPSAVCIPRRIGLFIASPLSIFPLFPPKNVRMVLLVFFFPVKYNYQIAYKYMAMYDLRNSCKIANIRSNLATIN